MALPIIVKVTGGGTKRYSTTHSSDTPTKMIAPRATQLMIRRGQARNDEDAIGAA
jgi:hypothetical protein